jgi:carotenoid cleavage dioxygenase-like enzyme
MSQQAAEAPMNWFRQGLFAPVTEEVTAFDLPVTGRIPSELNGRYLRNGPNFMRGIDDSKHHWFLGSGMVHGVRLRDGWAEWYRNRWVRSKAVAEALGEKWLEGPIHDHDFAALCSQSRWGQDGFGDSCSAVFRGRTGCAYSPAGPRSTGVPWQLDRRQLGTVAEESGTVRKLNQK